MFDYTATYYKVIGNDKKHKNHKNHIYDIGLNVDKVPFNPTKSCLGGGLYFTDLKNLGTFYDYGDLPRSRRK